MHAICCSLNVFSRCKNITELLAQDPCHACQLQVAICDVWALKVSRGLLGQDLVVEARQLLLQIWRCWDWAQTQATPFEAQLLTAVLLACAPPLGQQVGAHFPILLADWNYCLHSACSLHSRTCMLSTLGVGLLKSLLNIHSVQEWSSACPAQQRHYRSNSAHCVRCGAPL